MAYIINTYCIHRLHGCYANLDGGHISDALVDFTGGELQEINLEEKCSIFKTPYSQEKSALFKTMQMDIMDIKCRALMCAGIRVR